MREAAAVPRKLHQRARMQLYARSAKLLMHSLALLILSPIAIVYFYLCYKLGSASVHAAFFLVVRGCVTYESITWRHLTVNAFAIQQPAWEGGLTLFTAKAVRLQHVKGCAFVLRFSKPCFNLRGNDEGLLHIISLLQDVGYLRESRVRERPKAVQTLVRDTKGKDKSRPQRESVQSQSTAFQCEAHVSGLHITLRDGILEMPYDVGQIMGSSVQATAAAGSRNVARVHKKLSLDGEAMLVPNVAFPQGDAAASKPHSSWDRRIRYPVLLHLRSDSVVAHLAGWRTDAGFLLHKPIQASVHFTPQIAQLALSRLHPLLGNAVSMEGKEEINATLTPVDMHLPCEMVSLRLAPLKLVLETKAIIKSLMRLLNSVGKKQWQEPCLLEAWTSAIEADVYRNGLIVSKRMDILLGHDVRDGKGVHVSMWGRVDAATNAVEMVLGVPVHTLVRMGARGIEEDFVYQIAVRGTAQAPEIDWLRAGKDLAEIVLKSRMKSGAPFLERMFRRSEDKFAHQPPVPPPSLPFPWEAFATGVPIDEDSLLAQHSV